MNPKVILGIQIMTQGPVAFHINSVEIEFDAVLMSRSREGGTRVVYSLRVAYLVRGAPTGRDGSGSRRRLAGYDVGYLKSGGSGPKSALRSMDLGHSLDYASKVSEIGVAKSRGNEHRSRSRSHLPRHPTPANILLESVPFIARQR